MEQLPQVLLEKVGRQDAALQLGEVALQVGHRLPVNFDHGGGVLGVLEQVAGEHAHSRPDFQHLGHPVGQTQSLHDAAGIFGLGQEVLTEVFFGG